MKKKYKDKKLFILSGILFLLLVISLYFNYQLRMQLDFQQKVTAQVQRDFDNYKSPIPVMVSEIKNQVIGDTKDQVFLRFAGVQNTTYDIVTQSFKGNTYQSLILHLPDPEILGIVYKLQNPFSSYLQGVYEGYQLTTPVDILSEAEGMHTTPTGQRYEIITNKYGIKMKRSYVLSFGELFYQYEMFSQSYQDIYFHSRYYYFSASEQVSQNSAIETLKHTSAKFKALDAFADTISEH